MHSLLKYGIAATIASAVLVISYSFDCKKEDIQFVRPAGWPAPVYNFARNPETTAGYELGKRLFSDPGLSKDGTVSCANCHIQSAAFADMGKALSTGVNGAKGRRNPLPLFNLAWSSNFMWDGGVNNLEVQPLAPITNASEMNNTLANVVATLSAQELYRAQFNGVFGDSLITGQRVLKALAQYLVMLESYNSRYDKYVNGEPGSNLSGSELRGLQLFRQHCASCHKEPLFTNNAYENTGLAVDTLLRDIGRMTVTRDISDSLKFRVPSLRNVAVTAPYMHDGRFATLMQVLDHYTSKKTESPTLAKELGKPMQLTSKDKLDLIAFMQTLTDEQFVTEVQFAGK